MEVEGGGLFVLLKLPVLGNKQKGSGYVNDICLHGRLKLGGSHVDKWAF